MLRIVVALLLGANLLYAATQWGWLATLGLHSQADSTRPVGQAEVAPERIVIVPPTSAEADSPGGTDPAAPETDGPTPPATGQEGTPTLTAAAPALAPVCRAIDALPPDEHAPAVQALQGLLKDPSRWTSTESLVNGRWIVYIGKLSETQLQARRAQLRAANIEHRVVSTPRLSPGLALGTYSSPERARNALEAVRSQGVRDARVEPERAPTRAFSLQIKDLTPDELAAVQALEALKGKTLQPCP